MLCTNCSKLLLLNSKKKCSNCQGPISNNLLILCDSCSLTNKQCAICLKRINNNVSRNKGCGCNK